METKKLSSLGDLRSEQSGFSLVELVVVMATLSVLVGIAMPLFFNYKTGAYNSTAASDVRNLGLAVLGVSDSSTLADCSDSSCESTYRGFAKSKCSRIQTSATAGDENSSMVVGCCYGGNMGYMFSAVSGTTVQFPLSTGQCGTASL